MTFDRRSPLFVGVFAATLLLGALLATRASADPCADASLARQIARSIGAVRQAERARRCSNSGFFGSLFDGCRSLASQRAQLMRDYAYLSRSGQACRRGNERASERRRDRSETQEATRQPRADESAKGKPAVVRGATRLYCVRERDGYFFPAPNSQFAGTDSYDETLARCQFICDDEKMDVYFLPNASDETDDLLSVKDQSAYGALAAAFRYQKAKDFKSCDMQRYYRRMQAIEKAHAKPTLKASAANDGGKTDRTPLVIVVPRPKPERLAAGAKASDVGGTAYAEETASGERAIRIIGVPFLPNPETVPDALRR